MKGTSGQLVKQLTPPKKRLLILPDGEGAPVCVTGNACLSTQGAQERVMTPGQVLAALAARMPPAETPSALPAQ